MSLISLEHLDAEHLDAVMKAINKLVSCDVAENTYGQIVDGMPTTDSYFEFHWGQEGLLIYDHESLCDGVIEKTKRLRQGLNPLTLKFNAQAVQAFQDSDVDTTEFEMRLIELTAVACHSIAVHLYQLDDGVHKHAEHEAWLQDEISRLGEDTANEARFLPPATLFYHGNYRHSHQYPQGIADVVGYWAEAKIFGGVVLVDRGESETEARNIFLHPSRVQGPRTVYPPTAVQHRTLIRFLLSDSAKEQSPLPLLDSDDNRPRYEPYDAFKYFHIFRDRYETVLPPVRKVKHTIRTTDFPEINDFRYICQEEMKRLAGESIDEEQVAAAKERMKLISPSSPHWNGPRPWDCEQGGPDLWAYW
ncbi:hypothetical protein F5Y18DRAFT_413908 [Xylariaceae sp. FL1019]|nr:hypothetical protein F5Y18DRAFT_413908 [Xylariaceae sp. FL1019]